MSLSTTDFLKKYQQGLYDPTKIPEKPSDFVEEYLRAPAYIKEAQRTKALWYFRLIEKESPEGFKLIGTMARSLFNIETVLISLVDDTYRTSFSINFDTTVTFEKSDTFCAHTILRPSRQVFLVPDTLQDWRFANGPRAKAGVRFYAGSPLLSSGRGISDSDDQYALGTICVIDDVPHQDFDADKQEQLNVLAELVMQELDRHVTHLRIRDRDIMAAALTEFNTHSELPRIGDDFTQIVDKNVFAKATELVQKVLRVEQVAFLEKTTTQSDEYEIEPGVFIPLQQFLWESTDFSRMAISVPVFTDLSKNEQSGYLIAYTNDPKHVLDRHDVEFLQFLARSVTTVLQTKMIEKANRAKTVFIESVSHELRTPLHGILSSVELMQEDTNVIPYYRNLLNMIQSSGKNLINIINGLIDFNRWESDEVHVVASEFNVFDLQQDIADALVINLQPEVELLIDCDVPSKNSWLTADVNIMRQILLNLLDNAVKFTEMGFVKVSVSLDNDFLKWEISDSGKGISEKFVQESLFTPFQKEDPFIKGIGLGLSISKHLARASGAELTLVSTVQGQGTTFAYTLPVKSTDTRSENAKGQLSTQWYHKSVPLESNFLTSVVTNLERYTNIQTLALSANRATSNTVFLFDNDLVDEDEIERAVLSKRLGEQNNHIAIVFGRPDTLSLLSDQITSLKRVIPCPKPVGISKLLDVIGTVESRKEKIVQTNQLNILIVDDNSVNRNMLAMYCKKRKLQYSTAADGFEAFEEFKRQSFDIVLMDIQMPNCDGPTAVKLIRTYEAERLGDGQHDKLCIIIMLTGLGTDDAREMSFKYGANGFYVKPVSVKILDRILEDMGRT